MRVNEVFVDTACIVALLNETDEHHEAANRLFKLVRARSRLVTTRAVCLEIGNSFAKSPEDRTSASGFLKEIDGADDITIVPLGDDLYLRALRLFGERPDKKWSLTDCSSFLVMEERGITSALTTDRHFAQAGFLPLLREDIPPEQGRW